jgi:hypothetical protein
MKSVSQRQTTKEALVALVREEPLTAAVLVHDPVAIPVAGPAVLWEVVGPVVAVATQ